MSYDGKATKAGGWTGGCKMWETRSCKIWRTGGYKTQEINKFGKSDTIKIDDYKTLQTYNCNKVACLIRNDNKSKHTIYGLQLSDSKTRGYFRQCNIAGQLLSDFELGLLGSGVEDSFWQHNVIS